MFGSSQTEIVDFKDQIKIIMLSVAKSQWEGTTTFEALLDKHLRYILDTW